MGDDLELTVLLTTLDEGGHLAGLLAEVRAAAAELTAAFELLVVDGGSRDQTVAAAEAAGARVARQRGRGYGAALREGLQLARGRWVLCMDADGSHPTLLSEGLNLQSAADIYVDEAHGQLIIPDSKAGQLVFIGL